VNIVLTGLRGTGKSSIGAALARQLGYTFLDTDVAIEAQAGMRIADIVAQHGWPHFRALEREVVAQTATADRHVIAAGGGTLMDAYNAKRLKASGVVVLLLGDVPILQRRIGVEGNRPSLTGQGSAVAELNRVWEERRERYYAVADLTYDVSPESGDVDEDVRQKAAAIQTLLEQYDGWSSDRPTASV
jgi:shikimate kinase